MEATLDSVRVKFARADRHLHELEQILKPLVQVDPNCFRRENDGDATKLVYYVERVPSIVPAWSAIVGDALFNVRSPLDHLAWQLVVLDGGIPCEHTQFPIYDSRLSNKGNPRNVTIQPQINRADILAALDEIQPYKRPDPWERLIWLLRQFNNIDKHRLLLVAVRRLSLESNPPWWGLADGVKSPAWRFSIKPLELSDPVAWFDFHGTPAPRNFDPNLSLTICLDEGDAMWIRLRPLDELVGSIIDIIRTDINMHFVPLFNNERWIMRTPS